MENPQTAKTRAHKEDLLARTLKRKEARNHGSNRRSARAMGDSEEEPSSDVEFQDLDVYGDEILAKHGMNAEYNRYHPVYLDPTNNTQYIPLTSGNLEKWAKALRSRVPGVSVIAPPSCLKFETKTIESPAKQPSPPSSIHHPDPEILTNYLVFISIHPNKRREILNILLDNDINHYQMFSNLSNNEFDELGFSVGIVSKLCTNVGYHHGLDTAPPPPLRFPAIGQEEDRKMAELGGSTTSPLNRTGGRGGGGGGAVLSIVQGEEGQAAPPPPPPSVEMPDRCTLYKGTTILAYPL
ncbi:hypothetical protein PCASD_18222 [Puccinia coronata f. sp. avenae]|uniref:Uncharacterized protein n=1 Tax=Puccinia coronata f. sp. avenae TaxID=200324 RepID=A0A2N5SIL0_9BASI|nr:hypothetical protein PCASD_18222 [Puccinia coronata f. sp. avenae]